MEENYEQNQNEHQLWVNFSSLAEENAFGQLSQLLSKMFADENFQIDGNALEDDFNFTLSSDFEWRTKMYVKMLEQLKQRDEMPVPWLDQEEITKLHDWNIIPKQTSVQCSPNNIRLSQKGETVPKINPVTWTVSDIAKASCLLSTPPINTSFEDEQEMRRVYTLIYDTYRYKGVLLQALNDISFYQLHMDVTINNPATWLLLFDLYHRSFKKRNSTVEETTNKLFEECQILHIEIALWKERVKLAAAISRLRIKNSALRLSELLPKHLRDERVSSQGQFSPVKSYCTTLLDTRDFRNEDEIANFLDKALNLQAVKSSDDLKPNCYCYDSICPNFLSLHSSSRAILAQSSLVQKNKVVVQDRSFCLGPATFGKIILDLGLAGSVIQSHVNSPRTTAYLATLLAKNERITDLLVFSAGPRKCEYESYFQQLGMKNVSIYSEKLIEVPPDAHILERVIAVFATPPNSYSAVVDPIDLVCSRGGDLDMLEILTESELTEEGKQRINNILEEQRKTLKFAMSRPQIQLVLYETHSDLDVENEAMVQKTITEINKLAKFKHAALQGKIKLLPSQSEITIKEINNNLDLQDTIEIENISKSTSAGSIKFSMENLESLESLYNDVEVPNCDLFDIPQLPNLCQNCNNCVKLSNGGCYLALLQRKEVTKLDNKYMIGVAESRGLFGNSSETINRNKGSRSSKSKKQEKSPINALSTKIKKISKDAIELDRIMAPTLSSLRHSYQHDLDSTSNFSCPKQEEDNSFKKVPQSRLWWLEATRHLTNLRKTLINKKILPQVEKGHVDPRRMFANTLIQTSCKIDEIASKSSQNHNIPVYPRLRLTRSINKREKVLLPIKVTIVEFPLRRRSAMELLKNTAKDINEVTKHWDDFNQRQADETRIMLLNRPPRIMSPITSKPRIASTNLQYLNALKLLTNSNDLMKDLVSSRVPYKSLKHTFPTYGWKHFINKTSYSDKHDDEGDISEETLKELLEISQKSDENLESHQND